MHSAYHPRECPTVYKVYAFPHFNINGRHTNEKMGKTVCAVPFHDMDSSRLSHVFPGIILIAIEFRHIPTQC